jgi:hypothetical protein
MATPVRKVQLMLAVVGNVLVASVAIGLFAFTIRARRRR